MRDRPPPSRGAYKPAQTFCPNGGKPQYRSKAKATRAVRAHRHAPLYVYRCPNCDQWHITSRPQLPLPPKDPAS